MPKYLKGGTFLHIILTHTGWVCYFPKKVAEPLRNVSSERFIKSDVRFVSAERNRASTPGGSFSLPQAEKRPIKKPPAGKKTTRRFLHNSTKTPGLHNSRFLHNSTKIPGLYNASKNHTKTTLISPCTGIVVLSCDFI